MSAGDLMFLAHFSNCPLEYWFEQSVSDCLFWYHEALKIHKEINKAPNEQSS
jgi:hypothetical protein